MYIYSHSHVQTQARTFKHSAGSCEACLVVAQGWGVAVVVGVLDSRVTARSLGSSSSIED